ncbi:MAG: hypothetical protein COV76_07000, partial [Candidatus Omnitrophica bacterium CG11_big_fil_rev_8_21_14_0_20_64_10]
QRGGWTARAGLQMDYFTYGLIGMAMVQGFSQMLAEIPRRVRQQRAGGAFYFWRGALLPFPALLALSQVWTFLTLILRVGFFLGWGALLGALITPRQILWIMALTGVGALGMGGLGLALSALESAGRWGWIADLIQVGFSRYMLITNGVLFPVRLLPVWLQPWAWFSPLTQALILARGAAGGASPVEMAMAWGGLLVLTGALVLLGWMGAAILNRPPARRRVQEGLLPSAEAAPVSRS